MDVLTPRLSAWETSGKISLISHLILSEDICLTAVSLSCLDQILLMARWIAFYFLLILILAHHISMMIITDQRIHFKRHIGSARDKLFRAKQLPASHQATLFQRHQQSLPSPDLLRSRWIELFNEQSKLQDPSLLEGWAVRSISSIQQQALLIVSFSWISTASMNIFIVSLKWQKEETANKSQTISKCDATNSFFVQMSSGCTRDQVERSSWRTISKHERANQKEVERRSGRVKFTHVRGHFRLDIS